MTAARAPALVVLAGLALAAPAQQADDGLGRLFSTPATRAELNAARREAELGPVEPPEPVQAEEAPLVQQLNVNGIVLRSSGVNSSWINGAQIGAGQATREGIQVEAAREAGGRVRLVLPGGLDSVSLKPGEKMDVVEGAVVDAYERLPGRPQPEPEPEAEPAPAMPDAAAEPAVPEVPAR